MKFPLAGSEFSARGNDRTSGGKRRSSRRENRPSLRKLKKGCGRGSSVKPPVGAGEGLSSGPTSYPGENTRLVKVFTWLAKRFARLANSFASEEILERVLPIRIRVIDRVERLKYGCL